MIVGDGNTQINYTYNAFAVTGGVAPAPLVGVTGIVESPYRGLNSFDDGEESFSGGTQSLKRSWHATAERPIGPEFCPSLVPYLDEKQEFIEQAFDNVNGSASASARALR